MKRAAALILLVLVACPSCVALAPATSRAVEENSWTDVPISLISDFEMLISQYSWLLTLLGL